MCEPTTIALGMMAGASLLGAASSIQQGEQARAFGKYQERQANADAAAEQGAARVHAEKIRKMARTQSGEATAALAGSGVDVGAGTAVRINEEIYRNAEEDAVMTIFGGTDSAARMRTQGKADAIRGKQAEKAGYINAASTLLGSASSAYGWKSAAKPAA